MDIIKVAYSAKGCVYLRSDNITNLYIMKGRKTVYLSVKRFERKCHRKARVTTATKKNQGKPKQPSVKVLRRYQHRGDF